MIMIIIKHVKIKVIFNGDQHKLVIDHTWMHFDFVQKSKLPIISRSFLKTQNTIRQKIKVPSKSGKRKLKQRSEFTIIVYLYNDCKDEFLFLRYFEFIDSCLNILFSMNSISLVH